MTTAVASSEPGFEGSQNYLRQERHRKPFQLAQQLHTHDHTLSSGPNDLEVEQGARPLAAKLCAKSALFSHQHPARSSPVPAHLDDAGAQASCPSESRSSAYRPCRFRMHVRRPVAARPRTFAGARQSRGYISSSGAKALKKHGKGLRGGGTASGQPPAGLMGLGRDFLHFCRTRENGRKRTRPYS
jgi:hypothetical protein